jgi:hypothetical protein
MRSVAYKNAVSACVDQIIHGAATRRRRSLWTSRKVWRSSRRSLKNVAEIGECTHLPHAADIEIYQFRTGELTLAVPVDHPLENLNEISFSECWTMNTRIYGW